MKNPASWKRTTILFLTSQAVSLFGSSLVQYALMWHVTLATKSGIMMTVFIICGFLPTFLLTPFAGVWADRMDRKKLIIISDAGIAIVTLLLAMVFYSGVEVFFLIFLTAAIRALGTAVQQPALGAIIPQFVPTEHLPRVNGISGSVQSLIMLVSPIVSGMMLTLWPIQVIFFVDVVTAAGAIFVLTVFIDVPPHKKALEKQKVPYLTDMRLGLEYIRGHATLMGFFTFLSALLLLAGPVAILTPVQVVRSFGEDVWRLTAIEVVFSAGMISGGGIIAVWGGFKNRMKTIAFSCAIMAVCTILLGLMSDFWLYLVPMGIFGIAMPFFNTGATVLIQEQVEEQYQGRVFGVFTMIMASMMPAGMLLFGPLSEVMRIEWLLISTGALMSVLTFLLVVSRRLMRSGIAPVPRTAEKDAVAD